MRFFAPLDQFLPQSRYKTGHLHPLLLFFVIWTGWEAREGYFRSCEAIPALFFALKTVVSGSKTVHRPGELGADAIGRHNGNRLVESVERMETGQWHGQSPLRSKRTKCTVFIGVFSHFSPRIDSPELKKEQSQTLSLWL